ncbi:MAG: preprotein translocase subunit SecG [Verrucomicrobiota bacterium]|jgi:preprotein translocase subunit SecG|nr:preprotein translocase subunit SecG [Verrucomicrobiota bacterium]
MDIFIGILTAVEVIVSLLLILVVLMQRPRQEGLGASFGDAAASQVWGAQTTNVLQKFTVWLAVILFGLTLLLAVLVSRTHTSGKTEKIFGDAKPAPAAPAAAAPDAGAAKVLEKIQDAVKAETAKAGKPANAVETPKAAPAAATPAPATVTPAPAKAPEGPKPAASAPTTLAPAPSTTPAPAPAPAAPATQPK